MKRFLQREKKLFFSLCIFFLIPLMSFPHGGVGIVGNQCILTIGPYQMFFSGYQPLVDGEEFCDDIPAAGDTIVVLDFMQPILRQQLVDYRVLIDVNNIGINATREDLGNAEDIAAATLFYHSPRIHPTGMFKFEYPFKKGHYIGLVTTKDLQTKQIYQSVFPFTVGIEQNNYLMIILVTLGVLILGFVYFKVF